jgi:hypothetical protein
MLGEQSVQKIPTLFERDWDGNRSLVVNVVNPVCQWVIDGEGWPSLKLDGTCCMINEGTLYRRRELKPEDTWPRGFIKEEEDTTTGKIVGWMQVGDDPADQYHREAYQYGIPWLNGTYELVGPKIQGGIEGYKKHALVAHDSLRFYNDVARSYDTLKTFLTGKDMEGIVFHHEDGRMAKIKLKDFGLVRRKL